MRLCVIYYIRFPLNHYVFLYIKENWEYNGCQKIRDRNSCDGCPHVIRLLIGPACKQVNGQLNNVPGHHVTIFTAPEDIYDGRDHSDNGYTQFIVNADGIDENGKLTAVDKMNVSVETAKKRAQRARHMLKGLLEKEGYPHE